MLSTTPVRGRGRNKEKEGSVCEGGCGHPKETGEDPVCKRQHHLTSSDQLYLFPGPPATPCSEHRPTDEASTWVFTRWPPPSQLHRPAVLPGLKATWPLLPQPPGTWSRAAGPTLKRPPGLLLLRSHGPPLPHHQAMLTSSGTLQHRKLATPQNVDHSTPHS